MRRSSSATLPPRPRKNAAAVVTDTAVAPPLPSNKVAELVRKLAEAQLETQRLRVRVDTVQRENESLQTISTAQRLQHQQQQQTDERHIRGFVTTDISNNNNNNNDNGKNNETTNIVSSSVLDEQKFIDRASPAPPSAVGHFPPHIVEARTNQPPLCSTVAADNGESQQWKRKYAKLKHLHAQEMLQRDAQLAEVQRLVFQIHEEHDALRHRSELDFLQQQLEKESRGRLSLEQRARSLEEEAAAWRQRYLRLVEDRALPRPEGLNQTDPSLFCEGTLEQHQQQQLQQQQLQQQLLHSVGVMSTSPRREATDGSVRFGRSLCAAPSTVREVRCKSIAVQSDARTAVGAAIQTDERSRRAIGTQTENSSSVGKERAVNSPNTSEERRHIETVKPRVRNIVTIPHRGDTSVSFAVPWTARREVPVDHRYAPSPGRTFPGEGETSAMGSAAAMVRCESPAPVLFAVSNDYDRSKRERLEEDIRRHDQLLEAVAKLQRQAQRAAKTPSL